MRIRDVLAATQVRKISDALMCAYWVREWCSTAQMRSKPISSANTACSTQSLRTWRSFSGVGSASWASKIMENFTGILPSDVFLIGILLAGIRGAGEGAT